MCIVILVSGTEAEQFLRGVVRWYILSLCISPVTKRGEINLADTPRQLLGMNTCSGIHIDFKFRKKTTRSGKYRVIGGVLGYWCLERAW